MASLLVDIYIFFMGTPCNLSRMFSYRSAELIIYLLSLCLCSIDEVFQFSTRLNDCFNILLCFHYAYGKFKIHAFFRERDLRFGQYRLVMPSEYILLCTNIPLAIMIYYIILSLNICDFTYLTRREQEIPLLYRWRDEL